MTIEYGRSSDARPVSLRANSVSAREDVYILQTGSRGWYIVFVGPTGAVSALQDEITKMVQNIDLEPLELDYPALQGQAMKRGGSGTSGCGADAQVSIDGELPFGRRYRVGDHLNVSVKYHAPGCTQATVTFHGRHARGSPSYEYWCPSGCGAYHEDSTFPSRELKFAGAEGAVTLDAVVGTLPPHAPIDPPTLQGFQLCWAAVRFTDGAPEGGFYERDLGFVC